MAEFEYGVDIKKTIPGLCRDGIAGVGSLLSERGANGKAVE